MKKNIFVLAGLLSLLGVTTTASQADTIISVTETHYDANLRADCVAVRMNPLTFGDAASNACAPKASVGSDGPDRVTKSIYDAAGQVLVIYQAVGTSSIRQYAYYNYTPNGLKSFEIDANHNKTTFTYDGFDRLSKVQYPNTTAGNEISSTTDYETFGYDANNNRTNWRRRNGATITYVYDNLNRQTHEGGSSSADMDTAYDLQGRVKYKHFSTGGLGVDYTYDGLGRVISTTDMNGRNIWYGYMQGPAKRSIIYPDTTGFGIARDNLDRLTAIGSGGATLVAQTYDDLGRRLALTRGVAAIGGATSYGYDNLGRLTSMINNPAGNTYDSAWTFTGRNPAGQITTWGNSNSLFDFVESAASTENKTYDGLNRDASIAAITGGYDSNGNVAKDGARVMTYDFYNRLVSVATPTTPTAPFLTLSYDPEGRLASYNSAGQITEYLYDGTNLIGEYNHVSGTLHNSDTMAARYVHGDRVDEPLVWYVGTSVTSPRFFYSNYQGSVVAWTNAAGELQDYFKYDPYGIPYNNVTNTSQQWEGPRFRYTGQTVIKEARLYYYKARVYDPNMGRFLQTDPVGSKDDLDLYAYVGGDPINNTDPTGTEGFCGGTCIPRDDGPRQAAWASGESIARDFEKGVSSGATAVQTNDWSNIYDGSVTQRFGFAIGSMFANYGHAPDTIAGGSTSKSRVAPYGHLNDPPNVAPGNTFSQAQKAAIYKANMERNGGVLRSDMSGDPLILPQKSVRGVTPSPDEANIDHIVARNPSDPNAERGSNSFSNAQVLSAPENRKKSNN